MKRPTPSSVKASMLNCSAAAAIAACAACSSGESAGADIVNTNAKVDACETLLPSEEAKHGVNVHPDDPGIHFVWQLPTLTSRSRRSDCPLSEDKMNDSRPCYALGV
jgi:hypothetical protein